MIDLGGVLLKLLFECILWFFKRCIFFYEIDLIYAIKTDEYKSKHKANICAVTDDNVDDARIFQGQHSINRFQKFLRRGDHGYYAYLNNQCVHRSWVVSAGVVKINMFYKKKLDNDEVFIHYCETASWARGQHLYPATLGRIISDNLGKKIMISVDENNISSRRGVEKAGFRLEEMIRTIAVFGVSFTKKISTIHTL